jgi:gluconate 2-dehydrogenase alpha chain
MATMLKEVDAVCIGVGFTGSILARELTKAGLKVVGLERGPNRTSRDDFAIPNVRDDLKYAVRQELFQDTQTETVTLRHSTPETALPIRRLGSFLPGTGVGGAGAHWNGVTWRLLESDHKLRSHLENRYGKDAVPAEMTIADFPQSYAELEPYYDRFEKLCGISGKAGNLRGQKIEGGNVFEGPRQNEYPNKPLALTVAGSIMQKAAKDLGYHPFQAPAANMSEAYTNPEGLTLGACQYCGHCERFGCEANAKSSPQTTVLPVLMQDKNFELRTYAYVKELVYDKQAKKVKAVRYVDTRSGEEFEQPAQLVLLGAYVFNNVLLMRMAGIGEQYDPATGKGTIGKNYCYQVSGNAVTVFFEDKEVNPFMAAGASHGMNIDDFNGDNFDHAGLGFFGGAWISCGGSNGRPILTRPVPAGTPRWGGEWKKATAKWYNHAVNIGASGCNYAHRENYLDLDPTYKDALGRPLVRMTYNFRDNDKKMALYIAGVLDKLATAMKPTIQGKASSRTGDYNVVPYQSTHNTGGTMTGNDPQSSVVNRYCQAWGADNLFVMGASLFPQNASYNPTGLVGALAYYAAEAITTKYIKSPGPLVPA